MADRRIVPAPGTPPPPPAKKKKATGTDTNKAPNKTRGKPPNIEPPGMLPGTWHAPAGKGGPIDKAPTAAAAAPVKAAPAPVLTADQRADLLAAGYTNPTEADWTAYQQNQFSTDATNFTQTFGNVNVPGKGNDARTIITDVLNQFGLKGLDKWAWNMITSGASADQLTDELYDQPLFQAQFPGIFDRIKKGLPPVSITEYISLEDSYDQLVTQYGLPRSILTKDFVGNLIGSDVSPAEFTDRIVKGYSAVAQAPASVRQAFAQWFGPKSDGQLAGFFLNPKNNAAVLEKEALMAQVQGAGTNAGVNIGRNRAEQLAQMGDTYQQVASALNSLTKTAGLYQSNQAEGYANRPIRGVVGQTNNLTESNQGVNAALGLSAESEQEVEQRALERQNAFRGGGGAAQQATQGYTGLGTAKPF